MVDYIRFGCPYCGQHLKSDERIAGRPVSCIRCGRSVKVPPIQKINEHLRDAILDAAVCFESWGMEKKAVDPYLEAILNCPWLHWDPKVCTPYPVEVDDDDAIWDPGPYTPPTGPTLKLAPQTRFESSWVDKCIEAVDTILREAKSNPSTIRNLDEAQDVLERLNQALFEAGYILRSVGKWVRRKDAPEDIGPPNISRVLRDLHEY